MKVSRILYLFWSVFFINAMSVLCGGSEAGQERGDRSDTSFREVKPQPAGPASSDSTAQARVDRAYGRLPLQFEANQGQTDPRVKFLSRGTGHTLFLTSTEAVLVFSKGQAGTETPGRGSITRGRHGTATLETRGADRGILKIQAARNSKPETGAVLRMKFAGANPKPRLLGEGELPGKANYFIGNDPKQWHTNVPTYARVEYENLYPGIDLVYHGNRRHLDRTLW
ncbi:MAG TPA: hypothetical protein VGQ81_14330 [Acidobacteriota bacterium]|nr:hypothetical protein [Acidobacteriota bacterium]